MKFRGTLGGLNLLLEAKDTPQNLRASLQDRQNLILGATVTVEFEHEVSGEMVAGLQEVLTEMGGSLKSLKSISKNNPAPAAYSPPAELAQTLIMTHTLRSGQRLEHKGSLVVLGDVNSGVELIAGGDVIVTGSLRGVAHAGCLGNEKAIVWARPIASPQIRIADKIARGENTTSNSLKKQSPSEAEIALVQDGQITIMPAEKVK